MAKLVKAPRARAAKGKSGPKGHTLNAYKGALKKHAGILSLAAEELGVTRQAVQARVAGSKPLQAWIADIEEQKLDLGEGQIVNLLTKGDAQTVRWYMERKGDRRGYGNKATVEVRIPDDQLAAFAASLAGNPEALLELRASLPVPAPR